MGSVIIGESTVQNFVSDDEVFNKAVDERFTSLDLNDNGIDVATPPEDLHKFYDFVLDKFNIDHSGSINRDEFNNEMKKIMLAIVDGLRSSPIHMVLDESDVENNFPTKSSTRPFAVW